MGNLSNLDWVLAGIIALSALFAFLKGFVRELVSLAALIAAFVLACLFYPALGQMLLPWLRTREAASAVAFLAILCAVMVAGGFLTHFLGKVVAKAGLGWFDRLLGAGFGFVRGVLVCAIVVLVLTAYPLKRQPLNESRLAPYVMQGARVIVNAAPQEMRDRFNEGFERARQVWNERKKDLARKAGPSNNRR